MGVGWGKFKYGLVLYNLLNKLKFFFKLNLLFQEVNLMIICFYLNIVRRKGYFILYFMQFIRVFFFKYR